MRRRLFSFAFALTLLLGLATVVLWARSFRVEDCLQCQTDDGYFFFGVFNGRFVWGRTGNRSPRVGWTIESGEAVTAMALVDAETYFPGHRVGWHRGLPCWMVIASTAAVAAGRLIDIHPMRRKFQSGLCPICGYSLTGNTSGICPECGTPIPRTAEAKP